MNQTIADIFGGLLKLLHVIALVVIVAVFVTGAGGADSWLYAIAGSIIYVVVIGFITVVVAMHENICDIERTLAKQTELLRTMQAITVSETSQISAEKKVEPKL